MSSVVDVPVVDKTKVFRWIDLPEIPLGAILRFLALHDVINLTVAVSNSYFTNVLSRKLNYKRLDCGELRSTFFQLGLHRTSRNRSLGMLLAKNGKIWTNILSDLTEFQFNRHTKEMCDYIIFGGGGLDCRTFCISASSRLEHDMLLNSVKYWIKRKNLDIFNLVLVGFEYSMKVVQTLGIEDKIVNLYALDSSEDPKHELMIRQYCPNINYLYISSNHCTELDRDFLIQTVFKRGVCVTQLEIMRMILEKIGIDMLPQSKWDAYKQASGRKRVIVDEVTPPQALARICYRTLNCRDELPVAFDTIKFRTSRYLQAQNMDINIFSKKEERWLNSVITDEFYEHVTEGYTSFDYRRNVVKLRSRLSKM